MQRHIEESAGAELKPWFVGRVMRRLLDLKYSKIRIIAPSSCRVHFATLAAIFLVA